MRHQNWRDLQEWKSESLEFATTSSNEASKLFDVTLTQLIGWYDEDQVGGIENSAEKMLQASPDFILGLALSAGLKLIGTGCSVATDSTLATEIKQLEKLVTKHLPTTTANPYSPLAREIAHAQAMIEWSKGNLHNSADIFEAILVKWPTDMMALKFVYDLYFYIGASYQIRDCVLRVMPQWEAKPNLPLKSYVHGFAAFGLEETNLYAKAEYQAKLGLELNPIDGWSTHSLAHVYEMEGRPNEGIQFLNNTVQNWTTCNYLACHNYWHLGLYHIEQEDFGSALNVFDTEICKRAQKSQTMLDLVDATSLLYRLELAEGLEGLSSLSGGGDADADAAGLSTQWKTIYNLCAPHLSDQILGFNDCHFMMACLGVKKIHPNSATTLYANCDTRNGPFSANNYLDTIQITMAVMEAMVLFNEERYDSVIDKLNPIRYNLIELGGSHAQRDVFNQLLICAAIKSEKKSNQLLAKNLLQERKFIKNNSGLTDRFMKKLMTKM